MAAIRRSQWLAPFGAGCGTVAWIRDNSNSGALVPALDNICHLSRGCAPSGESMISPLPLSAEPLLPIGLPGLSRPLPSSPGS